MARAPGFTLLEMVLVVFIAACACTFVTMGINKSIKDSQGRACASNLNMIQAAKDEFGNDNPGVNLTSTDQLAKYLPNGIPVCPSGGSYNHILDLDNPVTCSLDQGQPGLHNIEQPTGAATAR